MIDQLLEGKIFVHKLSHVERGLNVESHFADDAECAQSDNGAEKCFAVLRTRELEDLAVGSDQFESADGSGKIAVGLARAVSGGGASAGNRNVRQRREIVERKAFCVEPRTEFSVGDAGGNGNGASCGVDER